MLRLAGEFLTELGILGRDADWASIEVAYSHHNATHDDQRSGREAVLLSAEQGGDDNIAARLELAIGLNHDSVAQSIENQRLLGLGQAKFPRDAGVLERRQRARAGAAVMPGDENNIAVCFRDPRRDRSHSHLGHELGANPRSGVTVLEVVDQLREVLD